MKNYLSKATAKTPDIIGDFSSGTLSIKGKCCPEDCINYFHPLLNWLKIFQLTEKETIQVNIELECMNTTTALIMYRIMKEFARINHFKTVELNWRIDADDQDMIELAEDYKEMLGDFVQVLPSIRKAS